MAYMNTTSAAGNTFTARIASAFHTLVTRIKERRLYRQTFEGLNALSNRELDDLGLSRSELRYIAKESAHNAVR
jgi:uncharacterized protein YjiS (DUF1127 family)